MLPRNIRRCHHDIVVHNEPYLPLDVRIEILRHCIQIRSLNDFIPVHPEISPALVIAHDEDFIRLVRNFLNDMAPEITTKGKFSFAIACARQAVGLY